MQWFELKLVLPPGTSFQVQPLCGEVVPVTPNWSLRVTGEAERGPGTPWCARSEAGAGAGWPHVDRLGAGSHPCSSSPAVGEASLWQGAGLIQIHPLFSNSYMSLLIILMRCLFHRYAQYRLLLASLAPRCFLRSITKL